MGSEGVRRSQSSPNLDSVTRYFGPTDTGDATGQIVLPAGASTTFTKVLDLAGTNQIGFTITHNGNAGGGDVDAQLLQVDPQTGIILTTAMIVDWSVAIAGGSPAETEFYLSPTSAAVQLVVAPLLCVLAFINPAANPAVTITALKVWAGRS